MSELHTKSRSTFDPSQKSFEKSQNQLKNKDNSETDKIYVEEVYLDSDEDDQNLSQQMSTLSVTQGSQKSQNNLDNDLELEIIEILDDESLDLGDIEDLTSILPDVTHSSEICRLCGKSGGILYPIFEEEENSENSDSNSTEISLLEKIQFYTPIKVERNDNLPQNICDSCKNHLDKSYEIGITALKTEASLKNSLEFQIDNESFVEIISSTENCEKSSQNERNSEFSPENSVNTYSQQQILNSLEEFDSSIDEEHFWQNLPRNSPRNEENRELQTENPGEANGSQRNLNSLAVVDEQQLLEILNRNNSTKHSENSEFSGENDVNDDLIPEEDRNLYSLEVFSSPIDEKIILDIISQNNWMEIPGIGNSPKNNENSIKNSEISTKNDENSEISTNNPEIPGTSGVPLQNSEVPAENVENNSNSKEELNEDFNEPQKNSTDNKNSAEDNEIVPDSQKSSKSSGSSGSSGSSLSFKSVRSSGSTVSQKSKNSSQETQADKALSTYSSLITDDEDEGPVDVEMPENGCTRKRLPSESRNEEDKEANPAKVRKIQEPKFEKWLKCNKCPASFQCEQSAEFHKNRHYLRTPVSQWCTYCSREFPKDFRLANHIYTEHSTEYKALSEVYKCPTCHRLFSYRTNALVHCLVECTPNSLKDFTAKDIKEVSVKFAYTCEFCFKGFAYVTSLNEHRNRNHSIRNMTERQKGVFVCGIDKEEKKERLFEVNTMKLAFVCKFCSKIFVSLTSYVDHLNEHVDGKFCCLACGKKFDSYEEVRKHRDQHDFRIILRQLLEETEDVRMEKRKEEQLQGAGGRYKRLGEHFFLFEEERVLVEQLFISKSF